MIASPRHLPGSPASHRAPRLWAFVLAALASGSAVFWVLQWPPPAAGGLASVRVAGQDAVVANPQAVARLLGAGAGPQGAERPAAAPPASLLATRMALTGVVGTPRQAGLALIAIDGKPARAFAVGSLVEADLVLQSVSQTRATLSTRLDGPTLVTLEIPSKK